MLPKSKRLDKKTFQEIVNTKRAISTSLFLFFMKNNDLPQYAFVASKGIFKTAVKRNKYRRIGYNILRSIDVKMGSGVFFYKKGATIATPEEIKKDIIFILNKKNKYLSKNTSQISLFLCFSANLF